MYRGKLIPQANFFSHFFEGNHNGKFEVRVKMIDGADNVFSLRRKELFWQYRLGTFLPKGLNERAADMELDSKEEKSFCVFVYIFACLFTF